MVKITAAYQGDLHCLLTHGPSGSTLKTDAPKDNMGRGEAFSPTDLSAASLLSCVLTTMGIYAQRHNIELNGAQGEIEKEMSTDASRRIARLTLRIQMPKGIKSEDRPTLERVGNSCPVHKTLSPDVQIHTTYAYPD
jgi:putative redox protein